MKKYKQKNKFQKVAQAMLEIAMLMSVFMYLLGAMIRAGVMMNERQKLQMSAFRDSHQKASTDAIAGNAGSYAATYIKDVPVYNPSDAEGVPDLTEITTQTHATRTFFAGPANTSRAGMSREYYVVNGQELMSVLDKGLDPDSSDLFGLTTQGFITGLPIPTLTSTQKTAVLAATKRENRDAEVEEDHKFNTTSDYYVVIVRIQDVDDWFGEDGATEDPDNVYWTWAAYVLKTGPGKTAGFNALQKSDSSEDDEGPVYYTMSASYQKQGYGPANGVHVFILGRHIEEAMENIEQWNYLGASPSDYIFENFHDMPILTRGGTIYLPEEYVDANICTAANISGGTTAECKERFYERGGTVTVLKFRPYTNSDGVQEASGSAFNIQHSWDETKEDVKYDYRVIQGIDVASSLWGDIDKQTKEKVSRQGLTRYNMRTDVTGNVVENVKKGDQFSTQTKIKMKDSVTRTMFTNPYSMGDGGSLYTTVGDEIDVISERDIDETYFDDGDWSFDVED